MAVKAHALYHESEDVVVLKKGKIEDGMLDTGDKLFDIDGVKPKMFKTGMGGYSPLYMVKWDCTKPSEDFHFAPTANINPQTLKKTMSLQILGNMLKLKKPMPALFLIIMGIALGGILIYTLIVSKVIKVKQ
jgi:hypothetical protein